MKRIFAALVVVGMLTASGTTAAQATGSPIKVMVIGPTESPQLSYPEAGPAGQAAAKEINAAGGVNGRPIEVTVCNDQNMPEVAADCARRVVADGFVAVAGFFTLHGAQVMPILAAGNVPWVGGGAVTPVDAQSPISFPITASVKTTAGQVMALVQNERAKRIVTVITEVSAVPSVRQYFQLGAKLSGTSIAGEVLIPPNSIDMAPFVQRVKSLNPDGVVTQLLGSDAPRFWAEALAQGFRVPTAASLATTPESTIKEAGKSGDGIYFVEGVPIPSTDIEGMDRFRAAMKQYAPNANLTTMAVRSWTAVHIVAQSLRGVKGDVTGKALLDALNQSKGITFSWVKNLQLSGPPPLSDFPRLYETTINVYRANAGSLKLVNTVQLRQK
jgi:branched-chain amino acid transport system substrate-binding protein